MGDMNDQNIIAKNIKIIRNALGLREDECRIRYPDGFYIIIPAEGSKKVHITNIINTNVFDQFNLEFNNCVFECGISIKHSDIDTALKFIKCTFKDNLFIEGIFKNGIDFIKSTFENMAFFQPVCFKERAR